MANSCEIRLNKAINFKEHRQLCRLCLSKFMNDQKKVIITKFIDSQYFSLTSAHLNLSQKFSQTICSHCHHFLNEFTIQRNDWIFKQSQLEKHVEKEYGANEEATIFIKQELIDDNPVSVKIESIESDEGSIMFDFNQGESETCSDTEQDDDVPLSSFSNRKRKTDSILETSASKMAKSLSRNKAMNARQLKVDLMPPVEIPSISKSTKVNCPECSMTLEKKSLSRHIQRHSIKKSKHSKVKEKVRLNYIRSILNEDKQSNTWEDETREEILTKLNQRQKAYVLTIHNCEHCKSKAQTVERIEQHVLEKHPEKLSEEDTKRIQERIKNAKMRTCPDCGVILPVDKARSHRKMHSPKNLQCDLCEFRSYRKHHLSQHMETHMKVRQKLQCHLCGKSYTREAALKDHIQIAHTGKIFKCQCGEEFNTSWKYYRHKRENCGTVSLARCPHCSREITAHGLAGHMKVDFEDRFKTFECTDCNQKFPNRRCLNHHQMLHKGEVYYCDYPDCNKVFGTLAAHSRHQELHENIRNYHCPHDACGKSFAKAQTLKNHIAIKHENFGRKCPIDLCQYHSGYVKNMIDHFVRKHKELPAEVKDRYLGIIRSYKLF